MLAHKGTETIETERLILRKFTMCDAEDMFCNWANDSEVTKFLSWPPHNSVEVTRQIISEWIKPYDNLSTYNWCIVSKDEGKTIGHISVVQLSDKHEMCEIGYCLSRAFWNKGIMTEALKSVIGFLFQEVGLNRIQAKHDVDNSSSGKVLEKSGMGYEGTLRQYKKRKDGSYGNSNMYSILKDDI